MAEGADASRNDSVELFDPPSRPGKRTICSSSRHRVTFHHPAYESSRLFEISAFDGALGGIHHGTALLLCGIIADGAWDGWLSEERSGKRLAADFDAVLTGSDYYFHVPLPAGSCETSSTPHKWAVIPSLDHLSFPHERPPPGWTFDESCALPSSFISNPSVSSMSQAIRDRDVTCRLSGWGDGIERAHLCPRSAVDWFNREEMDRYNVNRTLSGASSVDDMANAVALRQDIHTALDRGTFIFTRKRDKWVPHFLDPTRDLGPEHHNVSIEMPSVVSEAFVFVNTAKALFPRIYNFLIRGEKRMVKYRKGFHNAQVMELDGKDMKHMLDQPGRGRGNSPRKRQRDVDDMNEVDAGNTMKRLCLDPSSSGRMEIPEPPALTASRSSSEDVSPISLNQVDENIRWDEIERLRQQELSKQRSLYRSLACCDYDAAEDAIKIGRKGPKEYGGAHLCWRCLGAEIADTDVA